MLLLGLYMSVCVRPGRKPRRPVFSRRGSNVADSLCSCGAVETTSHYLLNCDHCRNLRIRYLYMIPPPLSIHKLLYGIQEATFEENSFISKQVQLYILSMSGSRNFHERGSNENGHFWSQTRGGPTPQKSQNYLF